MIVRSNVIRSNTTILRAPECNAVAIHNNRVARPAMIATEALFHNHCLEILLHSLVELRLGDLLIDPLHETPLVV
jgi:hypothetical protein